MSHFLVFLGSTRNTTPPSPARLGERVALICASLLNAQQDVSAEIIDPLDIDLGQVFKPHFAYKRAGMPKALDELANKISQADGFVMISPEYNHSMSPALSHLLNHFGSSLFAFKPSAIVTYSMGQWGGARAAVSMRTFLSELGCLPVSAMVHIPKAQEVIDAEGNFCQDAPRWEGYIGRTFQQLCWWADAAREHKKILDPHKVSPAFGSSPSQRNSPGDES